jgi:hypothetical protein
MLCFQADVLEHLLAPSSASKKKPTGVTKCHPIHTIHPVITEKTGINYSNHGKSLKSRLNLYTSNLTQKKSGLFWTAIIQQYI